MLEWNMHTFKKSRFYFYIVIKLQNLKTVKMTALVVLVLKIYLKQMHVKYIYLPNLLIEKIF